MTTVERRFPVVEVFPAIQGEGVLLGRPTIFVRFGGCDYRCSWCDSLYAVEPQHSADWERLTVADILARVLPLAYAHPDLPTWPQPGPRPLVTLSGGNPALFRLDTLLATGGALGLLFALETQGSIAQPWFAHLSTLTLSPKPPSSGMRVPNILRLQECVALAPEGAACLKVVVADAVDYAFARELRALFPTLPFSIQPCNSHAGDPNLEQIVLLAREIERWVLRDRWWDVRLTLQQHVILWGNAPGK